MAHTSTTLSTSTSTISTQEKTRHNPTYAAFRPPPCLLQILVGCQAREILNVEHPSIKRRYPDLVVRLEDERIYHLELQTDNGPTMPCRIVEYFGLIGGLYGLEEPPLQQVLYVGAGKLTITGKLDKNPLHFEYQVINIQDIDCRPLLESPSIADNLLAILCRLENKQNEVVKQILAKISQLEDKARRDYLEKLFITCAELVEALRA